MQVLFESRDPAAAHMREMVECRVQFVMRRLNGLVPRARVCLSDLNAARGGIDKQCQVELKTQTAGTLVITSVASDWRAAVDTALERAVRALVRSMQRNQFRGRRPSRMAGIGA